MNNNFQSVVTRNEISVESITEVILLQVEETWMNVDEMLKLTERDERKTVELNGLARWVIRENAKQAKLCYGEFPKQRCHKIGRPNIVLLYKSSVTEDLFIL